MKLTIKRKLAIFFTILAISAAGTLTSCWYDDGPSLTKIANDLKKIQKYEDLLNAINGDVPNNVLITIPEGF